MVREPLPLFPRSEHHSPAGGEIRPKARRSMSTVLGVELYPRPYSASYHTLRSIRTHVAVRLMPPNGFVIQIEPVVKRWGMRGE